jgi:hypothetical protein
MQLSIIKTENITNDDEIYNLIKNKLNNIGSLVIETLLNDNLNANIIKFKEKDSLRNEIFTDEDKSYPYNYKAHFIFKLFLNNKFLFIPLVLFSSGNVNFYGVKSNINYGDFLYKDFDVNIYEFTINLDNSYDNVLYNNININVENLIIKLLQI